MKELSLFAGWGGTDIAFTQANFDIAAGNEIHLTIRETLEEYFAIMLFLNLCASLSLSLSLQRS